MWHSRTESCDLNLDVLFWSVKAKSFICSHLTVINLYLFAVWLVQSETTIHGSQALALMNCVHTRKQQWLRLTDRCVCACMQFFFVRVCTCFSVCVLCGLVYFLIWQVKLKCPELSDIISYWIWHSYFLRIIKNMIIIYNYWLRKGEKHLTVTLNFGTKRSTEILQKTF